MLLYCQGPGVRPESWQIVLKESSFPKKLMWQLASSHQSHQGGKPHEHVKGRVNLETASDPETLQIDTAGLLEFREKQSRNKKAAEHKK